MHIDPDCRHLTYSDGGVRSGKGLTALGRAGMCDLQPSPRRRRTVGSAASEVSRLRTAQNSASESPYVSMFPFCTLYNVIVMLLN
jgi:hypothetical protein